MARGCRTVLCPGLRDRQFQELQEGVHELQACPDLHPDRVAIGAWHLSLRR